MNGIPFAMITGTTMKPGKTEIAEYLLGGLMEGKVYLFFYLFILFEPLQKEKCLIVT